MALFQESLLWERERRAAKRHWWQHLWVVPIATIALATLEVRRVDWLNLPMPRPIQRFHIPAAELFLIVWITWHVAAAFARDRAQNTHVDLGLSLLSSRAVALSKTIAPVYPALLLFVGILALRFVDAFAHLLAGAHGWRENPILLSLHLEFWVNGIWHDNRSPLRPYEPDIWPRALVTAELLGRALLWPVCLATSVAWVAARATSLSRAFFASLGLWVSLLILAHLGMFGFTWATHHGDRALPLNRVLESVEVAWTIGLHVIFPVLWLVWWWGWTKHEFADTYFRE